MIFRIKPFLLAVRFFRSLFAVVWIHIRLRGVVVSLGVIWVCGVMWLHIGAILFEVSVDMM